MEDEGEKLRLDPPKTRQVILSLRRNPMLRDSKPPPLHSKPTFEDEDDDEDEYEAPKHGA